MIEKNPIRAKEVIEKEASKRTVEKILKPR